MKNDNVIKVRNAIKPFLKNISDMYVNRSITDRLIDWSQEVCLEKNHIV